MSGGVRGGAGDLLSLLNCFRSEPQAGGRDLHPPFATCEPLSFRRRHVLGLDRGRFTDRLLESTARTFRDLKWAMIAECLLS
jgi:hypothetical protein